MAGLKSYLQVSAPLFGLTPAALYERQRALVALHVIDALGGRGPGSGAPLTSYNAAAILISVLAADSLAEVDERVVGLINAKPRLTQRSEWVKAGRPTFGSAVAAVLEGDCPLPLRVVNSIRVKRCWLGQISSGVLGMPGDQPVEFSSSNSSARGYADPIELTAMIHTSKLEQLVRFTQGALSQTKLEEDEQ
ncbi:MAG: hypothetical protein QHD01_16235 [Bradyrhizobium sp.]|uniref:hypothetical protein n=1 Tax=Bradyrhizobium sp. TaxID=376 RepID=UPI0029BA2AB4|nr:hypothetical protein [Bradyrhizobium sp.]MDX3968132.1 hypothetical protein [Bradyrhizobium sp.]